MEAGAGAGSPLAANRLSLNCTTNGPAVRQRLQQRPEGLGELPASLGQLSALSSLEVCQCAAAAAAAAAAAQRYHGCHSQRQPEGSAAAATSTPTKPPFQLCRRFVVPPPAPPNAARCLAFERGLPAP